MGSLPQLSVLRGERRNRGVSEKALHKQLEDSLQLGQGRKSLALIFKETDETYEVRLTYDEPNDRANSVARALVAHARRSHSNSDGDFIVAVCMKPSHRTIVTLLGAWKAGAAYVPLEPSFPPARVTHILTDAEPVLLVYDETVKPSKITTTAVSAISYDELCKRSAEYSSENLQPKEQLEKGNQSTAVVLYTSGSTGIPKGVRLSHEAVSNRISWRFNLFPFAVDERACVWKTALTFIDSVCEIWAPLLRGRALIVLPREITRDPHKLVAELMKHEIQRLILVPTLLRSILMYLSLNQSERHLQKLKLWVCSGETLSKDLVGQFFDFFGDEQGHKLVNFYGSTEVGDVTYFLLENSKQLLEFTSVPIGFSRIHATGDFGVIVKGTLLYEGRKDSQVKIRGHRIDLQEVNIAVSSVQGVDKCVVLCYGADTATPALVAFVTFHHNVRMSSSLVEVALQDTLMREMIPQIMEVNRIPLLVNGKVDRQALLRMYESTSYNGKDTISVDIIYEGVTAEDMAKAEALFTTIKEVVGRSLRGDITLRSNFYELGGNSLNTIFTITKLKEKGCYIEISDFLNASNLVDILSLMSTTPGANNIQESPSGFTTEPLAHLHKADIIKMVTSSFYERAGCQMMWLKQEIQPEDYGLCVCACWDALLAARLSVVLWDPEGAPVAVALNFDARREPVIRLNSGLAKIMKFLEHLEGTVRDTELPEGEGLPTDGVITKQPNTTDKTNQISFAITEQPHPTSTTPELHPEDINITLNPTSALLKPSVVDVPSGSENEEAEGKERARKTEERCCQCGYNVDDLFECVWFCIDIASCCRVLGELCQDCCKCCNECCNEFDCDCGDCDCGDSCCDCSD